MTTTTKRALIAESDNATRRSLGERLALHEGFAVTEAETGEEALGLVSNHGSEIIVMDVDLPDMDGRDLCRLMRRKGVKSPIIMLGIHDGDADIILALDSGASDYVVKPFQIAVLSARIRAQHRYFEHLDDAEFPIGPYAFRPSTKILTDRETSRKVHLTSRESAILKHLYRMGDRPASRQTLLSEVWGPKAHVTSHALETHIYRLRQKVEPDPTRVRILVTEPDGYRLVRA